MDRIKRQYRVDAAMQAMIDALPFYVLLIDDDHNIIAANRATKETLQLDPSEIVGHRCTKIVHGTDDPYPGCPLEEAVESGQPIERDLFDDERQLWVCSAVYPTDLQPVAGKRLYLHFARDVTSEKDAHTDLAQSLEHHKALKEVLERVQTCQTRKEILAVMIDQILALSWMSLKNSAVGFLREGKYLKMRISRNLNPEVESTCGRLALGQCLCGIAAEQGRTIVCAEVDKNHSIQYPGIEDHGHVVVPLEYGGDVLGVVTFYLPPGEVPADFQLHCIEAAASVTAAALNRKQMEAELLDAQYKQMQTEKLAALGSLVAGVAHEINNPLAGLKNCQRRLRGGLSPERRQEYLQLMDDGLNRIEQVVHQLLNYARLRSPRRTSESLLTLLDSTCTLLGPVLSSRKVTLARETASVVKPIAWVDVGQIEQALTNLLLNAIWVTTADGTVEVQLVEANGMVGLEIRDHGPGIPEEIRAKIEDPFFTTKPEGQGTGLGLSVTRTIVNAHQGDLTFEFPKEGGTAATIWLPRTRTIPRD